MYKLTSLTIFFPFFNDEKTVMPMITQAHIYGSRLTNNLEVIAIHGGRSKDNTFQEIKLMKKKFPKLIIINKEKNLEGYAVIKHGFKAASKDWIFYTDGDGQYDLKDLKKLVIKQQSSKSDVVCGYKIKRRDPWIRIILGNVYRVLSQRLFKLPIRDLDCDFRLIRKKTFVKISLDSRGASFLTELVLKLKFAGAAFAEVPVSHHKRKYGKSNYTVFRLVYEKLLGDLRLYWKIKNNTTKIKVTKDIIAPK